MNITQRILLATVALGTVLGLCLAKAAPVRSGAGGYAFESAPQPAQCYPVDPSTKKYLREKRTMGVIWKEYTCDFACVRQDAQTDVITGTQTDWFFGIDDGSHFVCRGYVMGFVETPMDPQRLGYLTIEAIRPFDANTSQIPELVKWYNQVFGPKALVH
jgi:hypothetical protein